MSLESLQHYYSSYTQNCIEDGAVPWTKKKFFKRFGIIYAEFYEEFIDVKEEFLKNDDVHDLDETSEYAKEVNEACRLVASEKRVLEVVQFPH